MNGLGIMALVLAVALLMGCILAAGSIMEADANDEVIVLL